MITMMIQYIISNMLILNPEIAKLILTLVITWISDECKEKEE